MSNVTAFVEGKAIRLKYLGCEEMGTRGADYFPDEDVEMRFTGFSLGEELLAIGVLYYHYCPEAFQPVLGRNMDLVNAFISKWYEGNIPEINNELFPFSFMELSQDEEDENTFWCLNGTRLCFEEEEYISDYPIFIRSEYFDELVADLQQLKARLFE